MSRQLERLVARDLASRFVRLNFKGGNRRRRRSLARALARDIAHDLGSARKNRSIETATEKQTGREDASNDR
jgi:hypothetical protein